MSKLKVLFSPTDREQRGHSSEIARMYFICGYTMDQIAEHMDMPAAWIRKHLDKVRAGWMAMSRMEEPVVPEHLYGMPQITWKDMKKDVEDTNRVIAANELYLQLQPYAICREKR